MPDIERYPDGDVEDEISAYRVSKPFIPHVLDEELATELGRDKVDIVFEGEPASASEDEPVTIYLPHDISVKQVTRILAAHDTTPVEPDDPMADIKEKLGRGETLSNDQVTSVLKFLLGV